MSNEKILAYYNELAKNADNPLVTRNKAPDFTQYDVRFVLDKVRKFKPNNLLDLGSGTGLLLNEIYKQFERIVAVELYKEFSKFIVKDEKINVINANVLDYEPPKNAFDMVTAFGLMNFFNEEEAIKIYEKVLRALKPNGIFVVKHQMGISEDVIIDGFSNELQKHYYSEYRSIDHEAKLLKKVGFEIVEIDRNIYPEKFNRWHNTRFVAIVAKKHES